MNLEKERRIGVALHFLIGQHDLPHFGRHEVIERIDVLLHRTQHSTAHTTAQSLKERMTG